jgi:hypothetical protein
MSESTNQNSSSSNAQGIGQGKNDENFVVSSGISQAQKKISNAQGAVSFIAMATLISAFLYTPDLTSRLLTIFAAIVFFVLAAFSRDSKYALITAITLFTIDSIYTLLSLYSPAALSSDTSTPTATLNIIFLLRLFLTFQMLQGVHGFSLLKKTKQEEELNKAEA